MYQISSLDRRDTPLLCQDAGWPGGCAFLHSFSSLNLVLPTILSHVSIHPWAGQKPPGSHLHAPRARGHCSPAATLLQESTRSRHGRQTRLVATDHPLPQQDLVGGPQAPQVELGASSPSELSGSDLLVPWGQVPLSCWGFPNWKFPTHRFKGLWLSPRPQSPMQLPHADVGLRLSRQAGWWLSWNWC